MVLTINYILQDLMATRTRGRGGGGGGGRTFGMDRGGRFFNVTQSYHREAGNFIYLQHFEGVHLAKKQFFFFINVFYNPIQNINIIYNK